MILENRENRGSNKAAKSVAPFLQRLGFRARTERVRGGREEEEAKKEVHEAKEAGKVREEAE